jgi:hypothetical protein
MWKPSSLGLGSKTPVRIPEFRMLRQEDLKFEASLDYIARHILKIKF